MLGACCCPFSIHWLGINSAWCMRIVQVTAKVARFSMIDARMFPTVVTPSFKMFPHYRPLFSVELHQVIFVTLLVKLSAIMQTHAQSCLIILIVKTSVCSNVVNSNISPLICSYICTYMHLLSKQMATLEKLYIALFWKQQKISITS